MTVERRYREAVTSQSPGLPQPWERLPKYRQPQPGCDAVEICGLDCEYGRWSQPRLGLVAETSVYPGLPQSSATLGFET